MKFNNLLIDISDEIALVTINRPDKLNALNTETLTELEVFMAHLKDDKKVAAVIITGYGEKAFIAGADILELNKCTKETGKAFALMGQNVFNLIENLGKPVIAAINGFALGGGCELALSCHIRIASENAKFGQPEVNLGIIPGYGGTQRLARLINTGRAAEYILTGSIFDAEEALRIGLVNQVCLQSELLPIAYNLANTIIDKGRNAVKLALESILNTNKLNLSDGLEHEAELFGTCCGSLEFIEGTRAFIEKRKPKFKNL